MFIATKPENCNYDNYYLIEESADSVLNIELAFAKIVSIQSKKHLVEEIRQLIQAELSKFKWIIVGSVTVDFVWYLNAIERQETDKVGDIDNITKPVQDALCGPNGILIDDSQISGLYTYWQSRNGLRDDNILCIQIKFNNDYAMFKKDLKFIQYNQAICMPVNLDTTNINDLITVKILVKLRMHHRKAAKRFKDTLNTNVDSYLVRSEFDFHRTRLNGFRSTDILTIKQLNSCCLKSGLSFKNLLSNFRLIKKSNAD